jgi:ribokinase
MGARVTMIGKVGNDEFGKALTKNLANEGVGISHISVDEKEATGIAMITLDQNGQNSIVVASGANMALKPEDIRTAWKKISDIDVLVMPLEVSLECVEEAVRLATESSVKVILNPAPAQKLSDDLLKKVDVLVPNESETSLLTGLAVESIEDAKIAAKSLLEKGIGAIVLTLGSRGALLISENQPAIISTPYKVNVVDTTAAGDSFVAALSVGIVEGLPLENALRQATAAGALAVTKMGAQPCMPTKKEVNELMEEQRGE